MAESAEASAAPFLRLHLQIETGTLPKILDRLEAIGQVPRLLIFERGQDVPGLVILDFDQTSKQASATLTACLERVPGVVHVGLEWRLDKRAASAS